MTLTRNMDLVRLPAWLLVSVFGVMLTAERGCGATLDPSDPVAGRQHWAFQPLAMGDPSTVRSEFGSPIDRYLSQSRVQADLTEVARAPSRSLLRRLYYVLTGLPPSREEVAAFEADRSPLATRRVVARLLSGPSFGERWGRHWMDLARYADSNGLDENFLFREAWRYRNWVIQAINEDVPYDRFLLEQIAGDLLPYATIAQRDRQRTAAGFMVVGPKVLLGINPNRQRMDIADEQMDTLGRTVLGMTLGCARCHDHKFDPIPTADYYALAGILTSTRVVEQRFMLGQQRVMERLVGLGPDGDALNSAYEAYYRELPKTKTQRANAAEALKLLEKEDADGLSKLMEQHAQSIAEGASDTDREPLERIAAQKALIARLDAVIGKPPAIPPRAMIPEDVAEPADEAIRRSGQFDRKGDVVPRGFLTVLSGADSATIAGDSSGRKELAEWLVSDQSGAGILAARVLANRIWYHVMGAGLVRTMDNFGRTGETPSHPELLDYLAMRLMESQWSVKELIREILLSDAFALAATYQPAEDALDPDNRWYWRAHRRRLEPEAIRDTILFVAGELDETPQQSTVWYLGDQATAVGANKNRRRTDSTFRSVYLPMIRNDLPELFESFDFADPHRTTGARPKTLAVSQGLYLMNDSQVMTMAEKTVARVWEGSGGERGKLQRLVQAIFQRDLRAEEAANFAAFLRRTRERLSAEENTSPEREAWALLCQALFLSSEFQLLD